MNIDAMDEVHIVQRKELGEVLLGLEQRNKYEVRDASGVVVGFAAEQGRGLLGALGRWFLGHWRRFEILVFDATRTLVLRVEHPFRWFFQRCNVYDAHGVLLGSVQQRWAFFEKRFDVLDSEGQLLMEMRSGITRLWTFPFLRGGQEVARIEKKWSGMLTELFTDADRFRLVIQPHVGVAERRLLLASAFFVDLQYFERKNNGG